MVKVRGRALLFLFLLAQTAAAQLPETFHGWESQSVRVIAAPQLASVAGNDAVVIREYGFVSAARREYTRQDSRLTVTLWRMQDATGSFGLFTYYRQAGMTAGNGEDLVAVGPELLLLQRGPYVLEAREATLSLDDVPALVANLPATGGRENLLPALPAYLPEEDVLPQSQKFLIGPAAFGRLEERVPASVIGFEAGAEALLAEYSIGRSKARLLLISYPTPQFATSKLRALRDLPAVRRGEDAGNMAVRRTGSLIAFVLDAPELTAAEQLLGRVRYDTNVTWNEYVPGPRDNVADLMLTVFGLAGFVLLFAFVAGLAFGGVRVLVKRFIPIPIFDRPAQMEVIRLHLTDW
jgi:hypothetical protein